MITSLITLGSTVGASFKTDSSMIDKLGRLRRSIKINLRLKTGYSIFEIKIETGN